MKGKRQVTELESRFFIAISHVSALIRNLQNMHQRLDFIMKISIFECLLKFKPSN